MEIKLQSRLPKEWKDKAPIETYETKMLYTGTSRYNTTKKTLVRLFKHPDGRLTYSEDPCDIRLFPRVYHTEDVTLTVYSLNPRVWREDVGLQGTCFFVQQQPIQTAST